MRFDVVFSLSLQDGYVQARWVMNADDRLPDRAAVDGTTYAAFGGVKIAEAQRLNRGGFVVFELAARFPAIDFDAGGVGTGIERDDAIGLPWHSDVNVRITVDYVRLRTAPSALDGGLIRDTDPFLA